jgi:TRAP-type C4-dicarboxylate transport system permease small subunit
LNPTLARLDRIDARLRSVSVALAFAGLLVLFLNSLAVVADVLLRAAFSAPIDRLSDVSSVIIFCAAACCLPAATASRTHITIGALDSLLSARALEALKALAALVTAAVFGLIAWQLWLYTLEMKRTGRSLAQIDISVAPFWAFVSACLVQNFAIQLSNEQRHAARAIGGVAQGDAPADAEAGIV